MKRRRLQFNLGMLMLVIALLAMPLAYYNSMTTLGSYAEKENRLPLEGWTPTSSLTLSKSRLQAASDARPPHEFDLREQS